MSDRLVKPVQHVANVVQQEYSAAGGIKSLADILNQADRPTERNVLDSLSTTDEELGEGGDDDEVEELRERLMRNVA